MLVGNKSDEESGKREVAEKTGQALQVNFPFYPLSTNSCGLFVKNQYHLYDQPIKLSIAANVEMQIHGNICEEWNKCN